MKWTVKRQGLSLDLNVSRVCAKTYLFVSNLSSSEHSHVASLFSNEGQKKAGS